MLQSSRTEVSSMKRGGIAGSSPGVATGPLLVFLGAQHAFHSHIGSAVPNRCRRIPPAWPRT